LDFFPAYLSPSYTNIPHLHILADEKGTRDLIFFGCITLQFKQSNLYRHDNTTLWRG
jgi:hypothetical protein